MVIGGTLGFIKRIGVTGQHERRKGTPWYHWFSKYDTPAERRLLLKLDLLIIPYAFVAYWIKFVDQANINNAYVSGMKEDLQFEENQLVNIQAMYTAGVAIGGIPLIYLLPRFPVNWTIPALELGWGLFTLLQYRTTSYAEIRAYRFFVGIFEAGFFPGVNYVLGSWYRADELGRRGGMFYSGQMLGNLTAGLLQSAASSHLNGVHGLAGWRWAFILDAIITFPVALLGFLVWPGTPAKPNRWVLTKQDVVFARRRLEADQNDIDEETTIKRRSTRQFLREYLWDWKFWGLTIWYTILCNTASLQYGGYLLWLKSLGRYSVPKVNQLGTTSPAIGVLFVLGANFASDLALGPLLTMTLAVTWNLVSMVILAIWNVPEGAKWFAFNSLYVQVAPASLFYGWFNEILRRDSLGRSATLMLSYMIAQSSTAGTSVAVFPTSEGPRFLKGWTFAGAMSVVFIIYTWGVVLPLSVKEEKKYAHNDSASTVSVEQIGDGSDPAAKSIAA